MFNIPNIPRSLVDSYTNCNRLSRNMKPTQYNTYAWKEEFQDDSDMMSLIDQFPGKISRSDVVDLASGDDRRFFLGTLLWGWGSIGYGHTRVNWILNENTDYIPTISKMCQLVDQGNIHDAYLCAVTKNQRFKKIKWWGPAYFTKLLYFRGLHNQLQPMPVILDSRVGNKLKQLSNGESWDYQCFGIRPTKNMGVKIIIDVAGYINLVNTFNNWKDTLMCSSDDIERHLFQLDKNGVGINSH